MSTWTIITADDVLDELNSAQATALQNAGRTGKRDPLPGIIAKRADYVRGQIGKRIRVSAVPHSVPPELADVVIALILERLQTRVPQLALTKDQKDLIKAANADLKSARDGDTVMTLPDDGAFTGQSAVNVGVNRPSPRQATKHSTRGF